MGLDERRFEWCRSAERARALAALFSRGLTRSYISHSELQGPRALSPTQWAPDISAVLDADLQGRVDNPLDAPAGGQTMLAAGLTVDGADVGVFLVTFSRAGRVPFAILEDIVIAPDERGHSHGAHFLRWIEGECAKRGIGRLFLESGVTNDHAHHFFEEHGFEKVSVVMMKEI